MSNFDFPRLNFQAEIELDVATGNNDKTFMLYDIASSRPFIPPRIKINKDEKVTGLRVDKEKTYVEIEEVNLDNYIEWATTKISNEGIYEKYSHLEAVKSLQGEYPSSWNYHGSLKTTVENNNNNGVKGIVSLENGEVKILDEKVEDNKMSELIGSKFDWGNSVLCDVDSIAQFVTQVIYDQISLTHDDDFIIELSNATISTTRSLNFYNVLNRSHRTLMPMSGSAVFYTKVDISQGQEILSKYFGEQVSSLSIRYIMTEVYEKHHVDYSNGYISNPAKAKIIGTIAPFNEGDLESGPLCRQLDALKPLNVNELDLKNVESSTSPKNKDIYFDDKSDYFLASILLKINKKVSLISIDLINTIPCYGAETDRRDDKIGKNYYPFSKYENFDLGTLTLYFKTEKDTIKIGELTFKDDYNRKEFIKRGGIYDFKIDSNLDYSKGTFYIKQGDVIIFEENEVFVSVNYQGNYLAKEGTSTKYLNRDNENEIKLSVLYRGESVSQNDKKSIKLHYFNNGHTNYKPSDLKVFDGMPFNFDKKDKAGCHSYILDSRNSSLNNLKELISKNSAITFRVFERDSTYEKYATGEEEVTWEVLKEFVLADYFSIVPYMITRPSKGGRRNYFKKSEFENKGIVDTLLFFCDPDKMNTRIYMPITRNMTPQQYEILKRWRDQLEQKQQ